MKKAWPKYTWRRIVLFAQGFRRREMLDVDANKVRIVNAFDPKEAMAMTKAEDEDEAINRASSEQPHRSPPDEK